MKAPEPWRALRNEPRVRRVAELARPRRLFLVGGCLRDAALGLPAKDLDLAVERDALPLAKRYGEASGATVVRLGGDRFAAIRMVDGSGWIDLLDLEGTTLDDDLRRRDFTVNAIAVDVESGEIHDPAGGRADLAERRLRATRESVFAEDPLRALRLARLALTLPGFTVERETEELARRALPAVAGVARERIRDEIDRILAHPDLASAIRILDRLGLLRHLFDEGSEELAAERSLACAAALAPGEEATAESTTLARLSLHWSFLGAIAGAAPEGARTFLDESHRKGLLSKATLDGAKTLVEPSWTPPETGASLRLWLHGAGAGWSATIRLRAALAPDGETRALWERARRAIEALEEEERRAILAPDLLLDGNAVQELLGIGPGPAVGEALAALRRAQLEGAVANREEAAALLLRRSSG